MGKQELNHTEVLYQVTKLTKEALERVESGRDPYYQYDRIKEVINEDPGYKKREDTKNWIALYLFLALVFLLFAVSAISAIAAVAFLCMGKLLAMFGCMLLFCLAFPGAVCMCMSMDS